MGTRGPFEEADSVRGAEHLPSSSANRRADGVYDQFIDRYSHGLAIDMAVRVMAIPRIILKDTVLRGDGPKSPLGM
jgi:hypothetical protein